MTDIVEFQCPRMPEGPFKFGLAHWRNDGTCSHCGSLSEPAFFEAISRGDEIGPTDKNYKVYVRETGKFYFQHMSVEGQKRFIDLLNARSVKIGMPGRLYVLPFFVTVEKSGGV